MMDNARPGPFPVSHQNPPVSLAHRQQLHQQHPEQQHPQIYEQYTLAQVGQRHPLPAGPPPPSNTAPAKSKSQEKPRRKAASQPRNRPIKACMECRSRKQGCDQKRPTCGNCKERGLECVYTTDHNGRMTNHEAMKEHKTNMKTANSLLAKTLKDTIHPGSHLQRNVADEVDGDLDDMEPTPMVTLDVTYGDDGIDTEEMIDLGFRVGKMRITERIGGLNRPRLAEEIRIAIEGGGPLGSQIPLSYPTIGLSSQIGAGPSSLDCVSTIPNYLRPSDAFLPPTGGVFFGQAIKSPSLAHLLLGINRQTSDCLVQRYFTAVHPVARCVHWPSFQTQYADFWEHIGHTSEPRASTQALVFAAWFTAAVSLADEQIETQFNCTKLDLVHRLQLGTETALSKANFLKTTKVDTMQAFIMYLVPLCRAEVSRAHSVLVGSAIRMAECMGLHRDGEAYGLGPLETHVRRILWHQLCFLDIRTCEAQGPNPTIRREDYDTKLPLNCPDEEFLINLNEPPVPRECWTPALLQIIRFELVSLMRIVWAERRKLGTQKKKGLKEIMNKIQDCLNKIHNKYKGFFDKSDPVQQYAKVVMHLHMHRLVVMVLHPYHHNTVNPMTARMNNALITSGIGIIEAAHQLETNPYFRNWSWYNGAYQQFQVAMLLATELWQSQDNKLAERIWPCLDFVFGLDERAPRTKKLIDIFAEIVNKQEEYMTLRKARAPTGIGQLVAAGSTTPPSSAPSQLQQRHAQVDSQSRPQRMEAPPHVPSLTHQQQRVTMMTNPPQMIPHNTVFAHVSNGEVLWVSPQGNPDSPDTSDEGSVVGTQMAPGFMESIDWDQMNIALPDLSTAGMDFQGFLNASIGVGSTWSA